jgi:hypothetical protein
LIVDSLSLSTAGVKEVDAYRGIEARGGVNIGDFAEMRDMMK